MKTWDLQKPRKIVEYTDTPLVELAEELWSQLESFGAG